MRGSVEPLKFESVARKAWRRKKKRRRRHAMLEQCEP
jgi:hypothetical protein